MGHGLTSFNLRILDDFYFLCTFAAMKEKPLLFNHNHDYVEIGGIKWATMNVGAKNVTDVGLYFAWGEIRGYKPEEVGKDKHFFNNMGDYKFTDHNAYGCFEKYDPKDGLTVLQPQDDPVHVAWRGSWRLPTYREFPKKAHCFSCVMNWVSSTFDFRCML